MNFFQFHIGDWLSGTSLLTKVEKAIYLELLIRYYSEERPIMQVECKRIANGYAPDELDALNYVLSTFFTLNNGCYHHKRCDKEIAHATEKSDKRRAAANARWNNGDKGESGNNSPQNGEQTDSNSNANAMQNECNSNANAMHYQTPDSRLQTPDLYSSRTNKVPGDLGLGNATDICPYEMIKQAFNETLPELPAVTRLSETRKKTMRARWNDEIKRLGITNQAEGMKHFTEFFKKVKESDFLTGKKTEWRADFDWLLKASNFLKTLEGKYDNTKLHNHGRTQYGADCESDSYDFSRFGRVS